MEEELLHQKIRTSVEWFKDKLKRLSDALKRLAGKAVAALPGIIGSVFGAVLNFLAKAAGFAATHVWALSCLCCWCRCLPGYILKLLEETSESLTHLFSSSSTFCSKLSQTCTSEAATIVYNIEGFS